MARSLELEYTIVACPVPETLCPATHTSHVHSPTNHQPICPIPSRTFRLDFNKTRMTGSEKQLMQPGKRSPAHDWANLHHFIVTVDTSREVVFFLILMPTVFDRILMMKMMTWDREIARCRICFPMLVLMIRHMQSNDVACPDCVHRWIRGEGEVLLRCFSTNKTGSVNA